MNAQDFDAMQAARDAKTKAEGYDYAESQLTPEEYAKADYNLITSYERGILTGGEFDCMVRNQVMPWELS